LARELYATDINKLNYYGGKKKQDDQNCLSTRPKITNMRINFWVNGKKKQMLNKTHIAINNKRQTNFRCIRNAFNMERMKPRAYVY